MIRDFKKDFTSEQKELSDAYLQKRNRIKPLLPISIILLLTCILFIWIFYKATSTRFFYALSWTIMLFLGLGIALLILTIIHVKRTKTLNKADKRNKAIHLGGTVLTIVIFLAYAVSAIGVYATTGAERRYKENLSYICAYEGYESDDYEKLLNKESTYQTTLNELHDENESILDEGGYSYLDKENSTLTEEEIVKKNRCKAFVKKMEVFTKEFFDTNFCVITNNKEKYLDFIKDYDDLGGTLSNVYTVQEALESNMMVMSLTPVGFRQSISYETYNSDDPAYKCYDEIVYFNNPHYDYPITTLSFKDNGSAGLPDYILGVITKKYFAFKDSDSASKKCESIRLFFSYLQGREDGFKDVIERSKTYIEEDIKPDAQSTKIAYKRFIGFNAFRITTGVFATIATTANLAFVIYLLVLAHIGLSRSDYQLGIKAVQHDGEYINKQAAAVSILSDLRFSRFDDAIKGATVLQEEYVEQRKKDIEESRQFVKQLSLEKDSKFDGNPFQLLGWKILGNLVTIFTLGILYPVKIAWVQGWKINHRIINGKRLHFDGNGFQLLGKYLLWWLLCVVTFGIFLIWLPVRIEKWVTMHTHFVDLEQESEESKKLLTKFGIVNESVFSGGVFSLFVAKLKGTLITILTLGILFPAKICMVQKWRVNHQNINGLKMKFDGKVIQLLGKYILWWLLCIVTLGIYLIWMPIQMDKWVTKHSHFEKVLVDEEI